MRLTKTDVKDTVHKTIQQHSKDEYLCLQHFLQLMSQFLVLLLVINVFNILIAFFFCYYNFTKSASENKSNSESLKSFVAFSLCSLHIQYLLQRLFYASGQFDIVLWPSREILYF